MGLALSVEQSRERYFHGWVLNCGDAKQVVCTRNLIVMLTQKKPTVISFDLVEGDSPLIIGIDAKRYAEPFKTTKPPKLVIRMPSDTLQRVLYTYIAEDAHGNYKVRVEIIPHWRL